MTIASGTRGTCSWSISDSGVLTIGAGDLKLGFVAYKGIWPWYSYNSQITSIVISGTVVNTGENSHPGKLSYLFADCKNVTSVSGLTNLDTSNVTNMEFMFSGCSSLTALDLSSFDTSNVTNMLAMFYDCPLLTSVTFGNAFDMTALNYSRTDFVPNGKSAENTTNGIIVTDDATFAALTTAERTGTWDRSIESIFTVSAYRTSNGTADEDGDDVTFSVTYATDATTATRELYIYQKLSTSSSYPLTPAKTVTLTGDSGTITTTISNVGDYAYDFKVQFYDGTNYFTAYPSIASNIRLVTIDTTGNVDVMGGGTFGGSVEVGDDLFLGLDTTAASGTDHDLYAAINALGWASAVIV